MRRRRAFKRTTSKQYGWACMVSDVPTLVPENTVVQEVIVAGDSDIEVRSVGNTHANLKRIVGDVVFWPGYESPAEVLWNITRSTFGELCWMIALVDNDDTNNYDPQDPTVLSEERIIAHGVLPWHVHVIRARAFPDPQQGTAGTYDTYVYDSEQRYHVDVQSNRRVRSDDDVRFYCSYRGTTVNQDAENTGLLSVHLRALVKFPG